MAGFVAVAAGAIMELDDVTIGIRLGSQGRARERECDGSAEQVAGQLVHESPPLDRNAADTKLCCPSQSNPEPSRIYSPFIRAAPAVSAREGGVMFMIVKGAGSPACR